MIIQVFFLVFQMIYRIEEVVDTAANTLHDWPNPTLAPDPGLLTALLWVEQARMVGWDCWVPYYCT